MALFDMWDTVLPTEGISTTIKFPGRDISLPGNISVNIPQRVWDIGLGGGSARDVAVHITNQYEQAMQQNLNQYYTGVITGRQAVSNFDQLWNAYQSDLDAVGPEEKQRALADRQRGGKFDWFRAYREPITSGSNIPDDTISVTESPQQRPPATSLNGRPSGLVILGLVLGGLILFRKAL